MAETCLYIIARPDGFRKLGLSRSPWDRLSMLRTSSALPLEGEQLFRCSGDARRVERRAHELLSACRGNGEWFSCRLDEATSAVSQAAAEAGAELIEVSFRRGKGSGAPSLTGPEIRSAREGLGLTQEQLAMLVQPPVSRHDISKFESGARIPGKVMEYRLREALERARQGEK